MSSAGTVFFAICATIAVLSACGTVASRTPIRAALSLLAHILSLAGIYLMLHAHLLAAMQLIVYAGAVVVLFVFVIMLIGPSEEQHAPPGLKGSVPRMLSLFFMAAVALSMASGVGALMPKAPEIDGCPPGVAECSQFGGVRAIASVLYKDAAVPFELVSVLLLVAILGAIAVARGRTIREAARLKAERKAAEGGAQLSADVSAQPGQ
jgi:NADH-quinone oxidoreductase subunit J